MEPNPGASSDHVDILSYMDVLDLKLNIKKLRKITGEGINAPVSKSATNR